jgi:hypothetical protein
MTYSIIPNTERDVCGVTYCDANLITQNGSMRVTKRTSELRLELMLEIVSADLGVKFCDGLRKAIREDRQQSQAESEID